MISLKLTFEIIIHIHPYQLHPQMFFNILLFTISEQENNYVGLMDLKKWILEIIFFLNQIRNVEILESTKYVIFPMKSNLSLIAKRVIFLLID